MTIADLAALMLLLSMLIYVLLDGTDLGVGMLLLAFHQESQRKRMINTLLPVWDANETWLVLLAGGMFALFPQAYSQLFSTLCAPVFAMVLALFVRGLALEYRAQADEAFRHWLDRLMCASSALAAFLQGWCAGVVFSADPQRGLETGFALTPLLCGVGLVVIYLLLGCCWIRWRVGEDTDERASILAWLFWMLSLVIFLSVLLLNGDIWSASWQRWPGKIAITLIFIFWLAQLLALWRGRPTWQLALTLWLIAAVFTGVACGFYPWLIPYQHDLHRSAASPTTQRFVLIGAAIVMPLTLLYHSWAFWVFRGKVR
ncbi:cytochrome d ubiquinol oxidase subunit II [Pantoea sp. NGS-ED-1003]|uniref:cytochrome d ubiquinol oxidase subunit II n=2 Tax=unclassified Pantoea TaxID=2630326 RepID=UPI0005355CD3|nr:cytochrome d ubiquinol oxidase subunit II [Pantoea sp. NGS-ED-1003]